MSPTLVTKFRPQTAPASDFTDLAKLIEDDLAQRIAQKRLPDHLRKAVEYSALDGGKRLRPILALLCARAVGADDRVALPAAAAIELIHCFSLVHDDLPAMDDDDLRRGKPTLHIHAGEAMAILAGDVMVSLAFEFVAASDIAANRRASLVNELAQATTSMIVGQVFDTVGMDRNDLTPRRMLDTIHRNKTAALLRAACRMGAIAGNANIEQLAAITSYGDAIGLMFQIVDDILDVTQSAEHTGKATGKDVSAGKLTFPGLLGLEDSHKEVNRLREVAQNAITTMGPAAQPLRDLCESMAVRTK